MKIIDEVALLDAISSKIDGNSESWDDAAVPFRAALAWIVDARGVHPPSLGRVAAWRVWALVSLMTGTDPRHFERKYRVRPGRVAYFRRRIEIDLGPEMAKALADLAQSGKSVAT